MQEKPLERLRRGCKDAPRNFFRGTAFGALTIYLSTPVAPRRVRCCGWPSRETREKSSLVAGWNSSKPVAPFNSRVDGGDQPNTRDRGFGRMKAPFQQSHELVCDAAQSSTSMNHLPGYPAISLADGDGLAEFLSQEFVSVLQDKLAPRLWWMSKQDSSSISPLHRQAVKRRTIVVTEDPKLHLVWIRDRIFVKPLPAYLANHSFWENHLACRSPPCSPSSTISSAAATKSGPSRPADHPPSALHVRKAALGYLRTYTHLIRHESDFRIAMDPRLQLLPEGTTWAAFCRFAADVRAGVADADVSERYRYGEIRLTRLNLYARLVVGPHARYQSLEPQYSEYFARIYGPVLFCIGFLSLVLSSLQVVVGAAELAADARRRVLEVALWFAVFVCLLFCSVGLGIGFVFVYKVAREWKYALEDRKQRLHENQKREAGQPA
ncbi:hypothetical protein RB595_008572 [Gaeumannomyces hyphopodioides]